MIKKPLLLSAIFAGALVTAFSAQGAKFYKWVDDNGVTHYGESPPDTDTAVQINVKSGASSDQQKAIENLEAKRKAAQEQKEKDATADPAAEIEARNKEIMQRNCETQRQNLGQLRANRRVKETTESGEVRYLSEEEISKRIEQVQAYINENCM